MGESIKVKNLTEGTNVFSTGGNSSTRPDARDRDRPRLYGSGAIGHQTDQERSSGIRNQIAWDCMGRVIQTRLYLIDSKGHSRYTRGDEYTERHLVELLTQLDEEPTATRSSSRVSIPQVPR